MGTVVDELRLHQSGDLYSAGLDDIRKGHTTTGRESAASQPMTVTLLEPLCECVDSACIVRRLRKEGCTLGLDGTHDRRLILDLDRPASPLGADETRCDYLVFIQPLERPMCVIPIELKNGPAPNARRRPVASRSEACRPPTSRLGDCGLETSPCLSEHAHGSLR